MTREEQLRKAYPEHIDRILVLADKKFLRTEAETRVADNTLSSAFNWHDTEEGWEFWNDLYERSPALT